MYADTASIADAIPWCLSAATGIVYFTFSSFSNYKNLKNDNFKYSFGRKDVFYNNIFLVALLVMMLPPMKGKSVINAMMGDVVVNVSATILLVVAIVFGVISIFSYLCLQPKKDTKLVESILERHMSDLSKGTSF